MFRYTLLILLFIATACRHHYQEPPPPPPPPPPAPIVIEMELIAPQKYVHQYGVEIPQYQWEESGQSGKIVSVRNDGVTCAKSYYCGALEGDTTYTFPFSPEIERVETYSQDVLIKETTYYANGQIHIEKVFNPQEPTVQREWYENGTLKSHEKYAGSLLSHGEYYDQNGQPYSKIEEGSGLKTMRDTCGMLWSIEGIKEGQTTHKTTYYPNGSPKEIDPYVNGKVHGIRKTYHPGGEPNTIETWVEGKQEGMTTRYRNGEKCEEIPYKNGLKNGLGRIYSDGAIVVQEVIWKDDRLHGPAKTYIEDRVITEWYFKGNKVTKGYWDSFHYGPIPTALPADL